MGNKTILPNKSTVMALTNFSDWLRRSMEESDTTCDELGDYIGVERKTVLAWINGQRYPKLDQLVKCYAYFDYNWIMIPFDKIHEMPTQSGGLS